jgi:tetraacyldisaccharide 4'-kinase
VRLAASLLWPVSVPYAAAAHLRARAYQMGILKPRRLDGTVISVGNLTVGGTGKTPMVLWIAQRLLAEGKRVGILTRGYKGAKQSQTLTGTSDEVRLLKARLGGQVPFGVGPNRYESGQRLAKEGVEWFVLDDGFQHLQLARDVNVVLIDATKPFGGGKVLPAGRLREPRSALGRADIVVITRSQHAAAVESVIRRYSAAPIFYAEPRLDEIRIWRGAYPGEVDPQARIKKVFAFCGIGNPSAFVSNLQEWGFQVAGHKFFRDHHRYMQRDAREIERAARAAGCEALICTEKDIFNLGDVSFGELDLRYCAISMRVENGDEFWTEIMNRAAERGNKPKGLPSNPEGC